MHSSFKSATQTSWNAVYWKETKLETVSTNFVHLLDFFVANLCGKDREFFSVWKMVTDVGIVQYLQSREGSIQWPVVRGVVVVQRRLSAAWWLALCCYVTCKRVVYALESRTLGRRSLSAPRPLVRLYRVRAAGQWPDTIPHHRHLDVRLQLLATPATLPLA